MRVIEFVSKYWAYAWVGLIVAVLVTLLLAGIKGIVANANKPYVCSEEVALVHRAFVMECAANTRKGVRSCTTDANQLFCKRESKK